MRVLRALGEMADGARDHSVVTCSRVFPERLP